jgi:hypothetical protein
VAETDNAHLCAPRKLGEDIKSVVRNLLGLNGLVKLAAKHDASPPILNELPVLIIRAREQLRAKVGHFRLEQGYDFVVVALNGTRSFG